MPPPDPNPDFTPAQRAARDAAIAVIKRLRAEGHTAYLAGGCVRDELLGHHPTDYDVATDATPERVQHLFDRTSAVGAAFGVVLVRQKVRDLPIATEVATFRTDGPYTDSRRPDHVTFASPKEDAERRDFTINALFLDPLEPDPDRRIIDHVNGRADLEARVIRAVGDPDRRFEEDDLRALRAVRFACRFGFEIEPATRAAITAHASGLAGVSRERIGHEVRRMLAHPSRALAAALMQELAIDASVLDAEPSTKEPRVLAGLAPDASVVASLLAWAIDRAGRWPVPVSGADFRRALMLSNDETAGLSDAALTLNEMTRRWPDLPVATRKRLATRPGAADARAVLASLDPDRARAIESDIAALAADPVGLEPTPLVTGDDLIARGLRPGPGFAPLLAAVYDAQLEQRLTTTEEALALAEELAKHHGITR